MFWSDGRTWRVVGPGKFPTNTPNPVTAVLGAGDKGTYDANGNWLLATFRLNSSTLIGFSHVENHGFDCPGSYAEWNAGAVVSSNDDGISWTRLGLAIHDPQPCKPTFGGAGYSSILQQADGFLAYGGCTAYRSASGSPGTWLRWLNGSFSSPGINGTSSCLSGVPQNTCCPIVTFNSYLKAYVMIYTTWSNNHTFYITLSTDGINFGPSQILLEVAEPRAIAYGQLIGDSNSSTGRIATLAYAAAPPTSSHPRDFVYRQITFTA
jgi:hypothetical protein